MKILKAVIFMLEKIIGVINILLIMIIVINLLNIILEKIQKEDYFSFLGYSYVNITDYHELLDLKKGDFVLIDLNKSPNEGSIVFFKDGSNMNLGKVKAVEEKNITILKENKEEVLEKDLKVMDSTATALCRDNNMPLLVFGISDPENIVKAVKGEKIGTIVK